jgi:hypothetical protein
VRTLVSLDGIGTALAAPPACGPEEDRFWPLDADEIAGELATIGLWHDRGNYWELHDYHVYNPPRAKVLADRARARSKKAQQRVSPGVSLGDIQGDMRNVPLYPVPVPVPVPEEQKKLAIARKEKASRAERAQRASTWPQDFTLTKDRATLATEVGVEIPWEWNKFKDHHRAKGSHFVDWDAAWRTWIRNAVEFAERRVRK